MEVGGASSIISENRMMLRAASIVSMIHDYSKDLWIVKFCTKDRLINIAAGEFIFDLLVCG